MEKEDVAKMLIEVARAAYFLCDDTEEYEGALTVDKDDFDRLSAALDKLDKLPEPGLNLIGTGPAKAEAFFKG